jgi:N-methylhydantoinase A
VLGRLPAVLLGGEVALDVDAARRAIEERVARPLGLDVIEAAEGIVALVNSAMVGAIRAVSIARGLDPRDYTLVAFGGAGPLHAIALARALGIATVLIPPRPGVLSTEGLLRTDLRNDYVQTCPTAADGGASSAVHLGRLNAIMTELERQADADLARENVPPTHRRLHRAADLRYQHQGYELTVATPDGALTDAALATIEDAFHREHHRLYSYDLRGQRVELVNLRVSATGLLPRPQRVNAPESGRAEPPGPMAQRSIYFGAAEGWRLCPCYARDSLAAGITLNGPLAIDQDDSTTVLWPGQRARVDAAGNLIVRLNA